MDVGELWGSLQRELQPGERLLWWGLPRQGFFMTLRDAAMIPIATMVIGLSIAWEIVLIDRGAPILRLVANPAFLLLLGGLATVQPFLVGVWARARTIYGITDRRLVIRRRGRTQSLLFFEIEKLSYMKHARGRASIWARPRLIRPSDRTLGTLLRPAELESVADGRQVYETLRYMCTYGTLGPPRPVR